MDGLYGLHPNQVLKTWNGKYKYNDWPSFDKLEIDVMYIMLVLSVICNVYGKCVTGVMFNFAMGMAETGVTLDLICVVISSTNG